MACIYTVSIVLIWEIFPFRLARYAHWFGVMKPKRPCLARQFPGHLAPEISYTGRVNYDLDGGRVRLAVSASQLNMSYAPAAGDVLHAGSVRFTPLVFSAQYNAERWSLTSEYALRHLEYNNFVAFKNMDFYGESYYFQGAYRFTPDWEGIVRYDVLFTDKDDRSGKK